LAGSVARNLSRPHRFEVFTPQDEDLHLTQIPGCFARLRMFDPEWQRANGITGRVVCMDLDLVVTGPLDDLFDKPEPFTILQGVNASNPCPFNGSLWAFDAGYRPDVWTEFTLQAAQAVPFHEFSDDQAWFAQKLPDAGAFTDKDGVYAFCKPGWPKGHALPKNARVVAFPGWRDPIGFSHLDWVQDHWRA
ncbi:MAG: hypothetical protein Q8R82_09985, partial [Hyphomonadaceae bacterium]|nr:hypothetical protein [Hyphomonadaceae bacterium]